MGEGRLERAHELRRRAETHVASAGWLSARELLEDALRLYREEGNSAGEIGSLRGLGDVALKLKDITMAEQMYGSALAAAERAGDQGNAAETLYRQGDLLRSTGRLEEAKSRLGEAAERFRVLGLRKGEAQCLGLLGEVGREAAAPAAEVLTLYREAHALQIESGDLRSAAVTLTFMANYLKDRDPARAAEAFVQAARIFEGLGLGHRSEPFLAAARKLDPANTPASAVRPPGPWDSDE